MRTIWRYRYVLICINDLLLITGSVITEMLETKKTTGDLWDFCSIFLGTGNLLVWIGMLRYLGFFATYNALILTLKGKTNTTKNKIPSLKWLRNDQRLSVFRCISQCCKVYNMCGAGVCWIYILWMDCVCALPL